MERRARSLWLLVLLIPSAGGEILLPAGSRVSVRLRDSVSSNPSQAGSSIQCDLIAPIRSGSIVPAGFIIHGVVAKPDAASTRLEYSVLNLQFGQLSGSSGADVPFSAKVLTVDNARETVDSQGVIRGLPPIKQPPHEIEEFLLLAAFAHPAVLGAMELENAMSRHREKPHISYTSGVEMILALSSPFRVAALPPVRTPREPRLLPNSREIQPLVSKPLRTTTPGGGQSDLTNVLFIAAENDLVAAFTEAGWVTAAANTLRADVKTFLAVAERQAYRRGPVSTLLLDGEPPTHVFEKQNNTFAKRHHIRIWRRHETLDSLPVWLAAATHDTSIIFSRAERTFSHGVDPHIDDERLKVMDDLSFTGRVAAANLIPRPNAPRQFQNATGDKLQTDGSIAVLQLGEPVWVNRRASR